MRSETAKRILIKTTKETKQKVKELTNTIIAMSEEKKTAEEILQAATLLTKGIRLNKEGAEYKIMIKAMEEYKNQELTQQQSANAELKQQLSDKYTAFILSKNAAKRRGEKIAELKKQNEELVEALKDACIDQNARYNSLLIKSMFTKDDDEKILFSKEADLVLKRLKSNQMFISKHTT